MQPEQVGQDGGGQIGSELGERGVAGGSGGDAVAREAFAERFGVDRVAGRAAGEQETGRGLGADVLPGGVAVAAQLQHQRGERFGQQDGRAIQDDRDAVVVLADPVAVQAGDPAQMLAEQQDKAAGHTDVQRDAAMPGMDEPMPSGEGLSASASGFTLTPAATTLAAGAGRPFTFRITTATGHPVTRFEPDQTQLMHLYLIRSDLTGFAHLHPSMSPDGTWSAPLPALTPGTWRVYTQFITPGQNSQPTALVLSTPIHVPGTAATTPLPAPADTTSADGYTLTLAGQPMTGMQHPLTLTFTADHTPVTDLQPYLDTYAHLTAIHAGDLAFAHLHPQRSDHGDHGGPALTLNAQFPTPGDWRVFIQFQTHHTLHTAELTLHLT